jgi:hypothetical protein
MQEEDAELFERISKRVWEQMEERAKERQHFVSRIRIDRKLYTTIKDKSRALRFYINDRYLNEHELHSRECFVDVSGQLYYLNNIVEPQNYTLAKLIKTTTELVETKKIVADLTKSVSDLQTMIREIYYAPGMPGYISAKESFEKKN